MRSFNPLAGGFALLFCLAPALALAADAPSDEARELSDYVRTGKHEDCLRTNYIRETRVLNHHQVLLETDFHEFYLGEMPNCPTLNRSMALVYVAKANQLCTTTIVHLRDFSMPGERGACSFESFELLKKKEK